MPKTFLIIEDDEDTRDLITEALSGGEATLKTVATLKEAAAYLARVPAPSFILSDLSVADSKTPDEIVATLRKSAPSSTLVLVSGEERIAAIAQRNGIRYIKKPIDFNELLSLLD